MANSYVTYLGLLDSLRGNLESLSKLCREKAEAVRSDDLARLDTIMRREQALSLAFRGLEQKKDSLLQELGLESVPLSALAAHFPKELQPKAKTCVEALKAQYDIYRAASEAARNTLECNLHQIERFLAAQEASNVPGPGYTPPAAEPPKAMKSDFRA